MQRVSLDGQNDVILKTQLLRIIRRRGLHDKSLIFAAQLQAVLLDRSQVRSTSDEGSIRSRERELHADVSADCARAEDANLHWEGSVNPSFAARPIRCTFPVAPLGISGRKTIFRGTLNSARCSPAKSRSSRSVRVRPSRRTTATAISSPSFWWGKAKVTAWAIAG